jgi:hypothetical protein
MGETKKRSPVMTGVMVAVVGLIIALLLGLGLMWVGGNRMEAARKTERPYRIAFGIVARGAAEATGRAQSSLNTQDWGQAQRALDDAGTVVTQMETAASEADRTQVGQVRAALGDAQTAVGQQAADAPDKVQRLQDLLQQFAAEAK